MAAEDAFQFTLKLEKSEPEHLVWGWLYVVRDEDGNQIVDVSGDVIRDIDVLEKAALRYAEHQRHGKVLHQGDPVATLVQMLVTSPRNLLALGIPDVKIKQGVWCCWRVHCAKTWARIVSGELSALSMGGRYIREEIQ